MHRIFRIKAYEAEHGPHFNEEKARKAVSKMENEDGTRGPHWSVEETTSLANQYGIRLDEKFNKWDWYVALNMIYSDYYKVIVSIANSAHNKYFVDFAKAWLCDKDIDEGKMWFYYVYVMCDKVRDAEEELYERERYKHSEYDEDEDDEDSMKARRGRGRMSRMRAMSEYGREYDHDYDEYDRKRRYEEERSYKPYELERARSTRYVRF